MDPVVEEGRWPHRRALGSLLRQQAAVEAPRRRTPPWRSALKAVGSALACICKPVCSGAHGGEAQVTRRRSSPVVAPAVSLPAGEWANWSSVLLGMWLDDDEDVLMRRLVLGDEYATRRRMEMQEAARWSRKNWFPPGPSRLSMMSMAGDEDEDDDLGENSSPSPQCSEDQSL